MKRIGIIVFCMLSILILLVVTEKNRTLSSDSTPQQMAEDNEIDKHEEVQTDENKDSEKPAETQDVEKETETKEAEKTIEEKPDEKPVETKDAEKATEEKADEKSVETKDAEKATEEKAEEKPEETKDAEKTTETKDTEKPEETKDTEKATEVKANEKVVYLTFDDGPTSSTFEILDTLDKYNVKATFFMLEPAMKTYPKAVSRTVKDGHGVGLHGVTHDVNKFYQSAESALNEMQVAQKTLQDISGVKTNLIRTPYGSIPYLTNSFRDVLKENKFVIWDWNVDSSDWSVSNKKYVQNIIEQLKQLDPSKHSPIILMHDRSGTASELPTLLNYLKDNNYQAEIIDEKLEPYSFECHDRCYPITQAQ
ncbi:polysaccharide deacetylase family protein [Niallia sp. MER 6]|uniref:polysaccharide deacetylase family protein n=1 Tax=unclassified Niallia TaxID=2837522 RepID=UPI0020422B04|nr:polysaccharide deacetylase family protein [Niallia sp. MER 6]MCM3033091.1 polysaccharide deacetylase [Niallia sp. MER 6]